MRTSHTVVGSGTSLASGNGSRWGLGEWGEGGSVVWYGVVHSSVFKAAVSVGCLALG